MDATGRERTMKVTLRISETTLMSFDYDDLYKSNKVEVTVNKELFSGDDREAAVNVAKIIIGRLSDAVEEMQ